MLTPSNFDRPALSELDIALASQLGETLKRALPALSAAFILQGLLVLLNFLDDDLGGLLFGLNAMAALVAWLGSGGAKKSAIRVTTSNLATSLVAFAMAVEILHVWLLNEVGFTLLLIAVQLAAGFVLYECSTLRALLLGSCAAWLAIVVPQHPLLDWVFLAPTMGLIGWWSHHFACELVAETETHLDEKRQVAANEERERKALQELSERLGFQQHAIRSAGDGHWHWSLTNDRCYYSEDWAALLGFRPEEIGDTPSEFFNRIHAHYLPQVKEDLSAHIYGKLPDLQCQFRMQRRNGDYIWALLRGAVERDQDDNPVAVSGSLVDVTHLVKAEKNLIDDAFQDRLTGLPNRKALTVRLERAVDHLQREPSLFAVIFMDLDRFKVINDSYGHLVGDQLLAAAASRLRGCLRQRTGDIVARFGGDEFVALLEDIRAAEDALVIAERFRDVLREPFILGPHEIASGGSIGIAFSSTHVEQAEDLLRHADTAMYRAKAQGKGQIQIFNAEMHKQAARSFALENDLGRALARDEFFLEYQPVVSFKSHQIVGAEALVRWQRSPNEVVTPGEFIALAEETGNIEGIGEWVLRHAIEQNAKWQRLGLPPIRVAVNVSAKQLRSDGFPELVAEALADSVLDPSWLELELTETALMANLDEAAIAVRTLRSQGVHVSIDDFGTGYSSLGYLRRFAFTTLKMDRSFVADLTEDPKSRAVAQGLIALAHNLRLRVTAEGVETHEQLKILRDQNCDQFQGFLVSRPLRAEAFRELLEKRAKAAPKATRAAATVA